MWSSDDAGVVDALSEHAGMVAGEVLATSFTPGDIEADTIGATDAGFISRDDDLGLAVQISKT